MRTRLAILVASTFLAASGLASPQSAGAVESITAYADPTPNEQARAEGRSIVSIEEVSGGGVVVRHRHVSRAQDAPVYAAQLQEKPWVIAAEVDSRVSATSISSRSALDAPVKAAATGVNTNDPLTSHQWPLILMDMSTAWPHATGQGQVVAVIDSGVDGTHPDLVGQVLAGKDYIDASDGRVDPYGHGTHVAGTIVARTNNNLGVASMAFDAKVMSVRVLDAYGNGDMGDVAAAIVFAADRGVGVINLSLGGPSSSGVLEAAVNYAANKNVVLVASAGNDGNTTNEVNYPCAYTAVVCVGAADYNFNIANFSNHGPQVDIAAPGVQIASTTEGDYYNDSGTSMASPHVAALATLLRQRFPTLGREQIVQRIYDTAIDRGAAGRDNHFGHGFINPLAALTRSPLPVTAKPSDGYWLAAQDGGVFSFGSVPFHGSTGHLSLNQPVITMGATPSGNGYRFVASDGGVFSFGDARFFGSTGNLKLNQPIVGMANHPGGNGYWLVARDGGIFSFGDAKFHGSTGALKLNHAVVGMAATPTGNGYWLVASDGGIFSYGDAKFHGSTGALKLNKPIAGMAPSTSGNGYWMVASDGGIFNFGDARFIGSAVGAASQIVSISGYGDGYLLSDANGKAFPYGDALAIPGAVNGPGISLKLNRPVIGGAIAIKH